MKNKIVRTFLTAILVHILLAITLYYTLGWADELPDELTARPTLVLLGTFASAVLWFTLSPQGYATRAQFAAIICRFCAKVMK